MSSAVTAMSANNDVSAPENVATGDDDPETGSPDAPTDIAAQASATGDPPGSASASAATTAATAPEMPSPRVRVPPMGNMVCEYCPEGPCDPPADDAETCDFHDRFLVNVLAPAWPPKTPEERVPLHKPLGAASAVSALIQQSGQKAAQAASSNAFVGGLIKSIVAKLNLPPPKDADKTPAPPERRTGFWKAKIVHRPEAADAGDEIDDVDDDALPVAGADEPDGAQDSAGKGGMGKVSALAGAAGLPLPPVPVASPADKLSALSDKVARHVADNRLKNCRPKEAFERHANMVSLVKLRSRGAALENPLEALTHPATLAAGLSAGPSSKEVERFVNQIDECPAKALETVKVKAVQDVAGVAEGAAHRRTPPLPLIAPAFQYRAAGRFFCKLGSHGNAERVRRALLPSSSQF